MANSNDEFMGSRRDDSIASPQFSGEYFLLPQEVLSELESNAPACTCYGSVVCPACEEQALRALFGPVVRVAE